MVRIHQLKDIVRVETKKKKKEKIPNYRFVYKNFNSHIMKYISKNMMKSYTIQPIKGKVRLTSLISCKINFGINKGIIKRKLQFPNSFTEELLENWGTWVAQWVERPNWAHVMISQFVSLSPT